MGAKAVNSTIKKILVANRGEIAVRIFKTCKRLGIKTVAIYSDADRFALHTRSADERFYVGESEAKSSYLQISKIIEAIKATGADAVHPGYGFLSESAEFSDAVSAAGAVFLGPSGAQMKSLGDKEQAKNTAKTLNIPVLQSERADPATIPSMPFPLMIKARAGGGGRGMRVVRSAEEFPSAATSATREALSFFSDGTVFVERFIERARHVEVQLLGDGRTALSIGDRDCTVQRKHQKVLEEAPAFGLSDKLRSKLHDDAERLLASVNYRGAGTAEFLVCGEEYFFLEVNTRLQVEHPVTEAVTGLDLVELQIRIGEGATLKSILPHGVTTSGNAIELRICAEKPQDNFTPSTGTIAAIFPPPNARFDYGFSTLDTVSHYYDSLLGKLIIKGETRDDAISAATCLLHSPLILGVETNQRFLLQLISHPEFLSGSHFTRWIDEVKLNPLPSFEDALTASQSLATDQFRVGFSTPRYKVSSNSQQSVEISQLPRQIYRTGRGDFIFYDGVSFPVLISCPSLKAASVSAESNSRSGMALVNSPLPGKILEIKVKPGQSVKFGDTLIILESMKMEHPIKASISGVIKRMCVASQQVVDAGMVLAEIEN